MIPGSNLLNQALNVIGRQSFQYIAYASRVLQSNGQYLTTYKSPVNCAGSVQPVSRYLALIMGLDFEKNRYLHFYVSRSIFAVGRNISGDQFIFNCKTYQALSKTPWASIDGWDEVLTVEVS